MVIYRQQWEQQGLVKVYECCNYQMLSNLILPWCPKLQPISQFSHDRAGTSQRSSCFFYIYLYISNRLKLLLMKEISLWSVPEVLKGFQHLIFLNKIVDEGGGCICLKLFTSFREKTYLVTAYGERLIGFAVYVINLDILFTQKKITTKNTALTQCFVTENTPIKGSESVIQPAQAVGPPGCRQNCQCSVESPGRFFGQ